MKIVRFTPKDLPATPTYGRLDDKAANIIHVLEGDIGTGFTETAKTVNVDEITLLPPTVPSKALCVGLNYKDHIAEIKGTTPTKPTIFMKPTSSLLAPNAAIIRPAMSERVDFEGELTIVIGKEAKNIAQENARDYIFGYTCGNDVTARDLQVITEQWTVAKGFDTFLPIGPCIETDLDPTNLSIRTTLNGAVMQESNTKHLLFTTNYIVSYLSNVMTLFPGDIILTGTPSGIAPMKKGDTVAVVIDGIGTLENSVE